LWERLNWWGAGSPRERDQGHLARGATHSGPAGAHNPFHSSAAALILALPALFYGFGHYFIVGEGVSPTCVLFLCMCSRRST
jgi:hypothetical protein